MDPLPPSLPNTGLTQPAPAGMAGLAILLAELSETLANLPAGTQIPAQVTQILPQITLQTPPQALTPTLPPAADPPAAKNPVFSGPLLQLSTPQGPVRIRVPAAVQIPLGAKLAITVAAAGPQPQWRLTMIDGKPACLAVPAPPASVAAPASTVAPAAKDAPTPLPAPGIPATLVKSADPSMPSGTILLVRITNLLPSPPPQSQPSAPAPAPDQEAELALLPETAPEEEPAPGAQTATSIAASIAAPAPSAPPVPVAMTVLPLPAISPQPAATAAPIVTAPAPTAAAAPAPAPAPDPTAAAPTPVAAPMATGRPTVTAAPTPAGMPTATAAPIPLTAPTQTAAPLPVLNAAPVPLSAVIPPPTPAAAPPPPEIGGEVLPNTDTGRPLIKTMLGLLALRLDAQSAPPAGAHVTLTVIGKPVPPAIASLPAPADEMPAKALPRRLSDLVDRLEASGSEKLAGSLRQAIPSPGPKLAAQLLAAIAAAEPSQGLPRWLGDSLTAALTRSAPDAVAQLSRQWEAISQPVHGPDDGAWRTLLLPLMMGGQINLLRLTTRRQGRGAHPADRETGARFLLDLDLSRLGPMQFDGLVKRRAKQFDLIIRTHAPLSGEMRRDIDGLFLNGLKNFGLTGSIGFQGAGSFIATTPLTEDANGIIFA